MSDIMVRFLNESYTFPEELKQYVIYCNEFEKINNRLQKELICTMKKKPMIRVDLMRWVILRAD
jgi:hypothetical protein